jgi:hypothetical protein
LVTADFRLKRRQYLTRAAVNRQSAMFNGQ